MNSRQRLRRTGRNRGTVIVLFAAGMVFFTGMLALTLDVGMVHYFSAVSDRAVNAAALTAARTMARPGATADDARAAAKAVADANGIGGFELTDVEVDPFGNNQRVVRLNPSVRIPAFFAPLFGIDGFDVPYTVLAMGGGTGSTLLTPDFFDPGNEDAASGFYPLFLYHGNLAAMVQEDGANTGTGNQKEDALEDHICHAGTFFNRGDAVWLKGGSRTQNSIKRFMKSANKPWVRGQYAGSFDLPYAGIPTADSRYSTFMRNAALRPVVPGENLLLVRDGHSWVDDADADAVAARVAEDAGSGWSSHGAGSARTVIVPICRANVDMTADLTAGTRVDDFLTLPYIYPEVNNPGVNGGIGNNWGVQMTLSVIGLAKVWLLGPVDVDVPHGRSFNVIRAVFLEYVGTPPNGQRQGP